MLLLVITTIGKTLSTIINKVELITVSRTHNLSQDEQY